MSTIIIGVDEAQGEVFAYDLETAKGNQDLGNYFDAVRNYGEGEFADGFWYFQSGEWQRVEFEHSLTPWDENDYATHIIKVRVNGELLHEMSSSVDGRG